MAKITEWGPNGWKFMHAVTFSAPANMTADEKEWYKKFFESVAHILPCAKCRQHLQEHMRADPIDLETGQSLARWLWRVHNAVNRSLGKQEVSFERATELFMEGAEIQEPSDPLVWFFGAILGLLVVGIIVVLVLRK